MKMDDVKVGQKVRVTGSPDTATVKVIDEDDNMVFVAEPIVGGGGRTELIEVDPADLEVAS